jgi:hypothetical protein
MTVQFDDVPLDDLVKALDARLDALSVVKPPGHSPSVVPGEDSDTVTRARAQLAAAEAQARRRAEEQAGEPPPQSLAPRFRPSETIDSALNAILAGLRELAVDPQFRETLRQRALRHAPAEESGESQRPWEALGLTREIWAKLRKAGKLKDD